MAKKAVLIGCNYPGTQAELKGCVNDVRRMRDCLVERYGFSEQDITMLIDTDNSYPQPTGRNIIAALADLVSSAAAGDFLFVHYSGHGTRLPADTGEDDDTGYDECIVPTDMNLITDDDFRELVDKVPKGCKITIVSDSCHSGGLIDAAKEQIGDSTKKTKEQLVDNNNNNKSIFGIKNFLRKTVEGAIESRGIHIPSELHLRHHHQESEELHTKDKSLPLSTLMEMLKQKTGKDDIDIGKLRPTLFAVFGDDATPKIKKLMDVILSKIEGHEHLEGVLGLVGGLALQFFDQKLGKKNGNTNDNSSVLSDSGILISGCQTDETSADATPSGDASRAYGALSNAIQTIIAGSNGRVSNRELVIKASELLKKQGFPQHPGLYCSDDHVDDPFIC